MILVEWEQDGSNCWQQFPISKKEEAFMLVQELEESGYTVFVEWDYGDV